jgi:hypothetical protein
MTESFFLTLNSNARGEFENVNRNSSFKTHLGKMITFESAFEVALVDLRVPMTLENVHAKMNEIVVISNNVNQQMLAKNYKLKTGYYHNTAMLISELNQLLGEFLYFEVNENGFVTIDTEKDGGLSVFYFSEGLKHILGLERGEIIGQKNFHEGALPINLNRGLHNTLNINTNIIEHQLVDNTHNASLRIVSTGVEKYDYGFDKMYSFQRLHYKKLNCSRLEYIEININSENMEPASFTFGNSTVTLHFRRCLE